jgi:hypothetical protein
VLNCLYAVTFLSPYEQESPWHCPLAKKKPEPKGEKGKKKDKREKEKK